MKNFTLSIFILTIIGFAFNFTEGFLDTLGITKEEAERSVFTSFAGGNFNEPGSKIYHSIPVSVRVAMVKEIGAFAKAYTKGEAFKRNYEEMRESLKPLSPQSSLPMDDFKKQQKEEISKSIKEAESTLVNYTGESRKAVEESIGVLKEQLKQLDDPNSPLFGNNMDSLTQKNYELEMKDYNYKLQEWEQEYPPSPNKIIRDRLNYFLQLSSTVDFNARLTQGPNGKMLFVNPEYEEQSADWKMLFRSGKESVDAARFVAQQWLEELK